MAALECLKDNVMILRVLRLIKSIPILSNLKIRMDGIITKIEEFVFQDILFVTDSGKLFNLLIEKIDKYAIAMGE